MYSNTPPVPPPKPGSHDTSRISTPLTTHSPAPPPLPEAQARPADPSSINPRVAQPEPLPDPGDQWLPRYLEDKSKQDLADVLSSPALLSALTHAPRAAHPTVSAGHDALQAALAENLELAARLLELEAHVGAARQDAQGRLLSTHALERAWRAKQADMDVALAPLAPASLYQRLAQSVAEQEAVCRALEESFLDGGGAGGDGGSSGLGAGVSDGGERRGGVATERETTEWVKRYREAKKVYYLRRERKDRWDEGRVGGWR